MKTILIMKTFLLIFSIILTSSTIVHSIDTRQTDITNQVINSNLPSNLIDEWQETKKLIANDGSPGDWFGVSVAIEGEYAVVGARDDDGEKGSAYVFKKENNLWEFDKKLTASDGLGGDWFGITVAIKNQTVFVGADADDNENGVNAGSVYIYSKINGNWEQTQKLIASDGVSNDYFGRYIAADTDIIVVGAYYDDNISGSAYIFTKVSNDWIEETKLVASDRAPGDYFGVSAAIRDDYLVIGAYRDDNENGDDSGSAYIFQKTYKGWSQQSKLIASDGIASDRFGISVTINENNIFVGAYYANSFTGAAYLFSQIESDWIETAKITASDASQNQLFGRSISINDSTLIIGAPGDNSNQGAAYIFQYYNNSWIEIQKIISRDGDVSDHFGYQLAHHDDHAIVGAFGDDNSNGNDAGCSYIFGKNITPNLDAYGNLSLYDVSPGKITYGKFYLENIGEPYSLLSWEISSYPDWGEWTFTPTHGVDLTPEQGPLTIKVKITAPDQKNHEFIGEIKVINLDNSSDYDIINVTLSTSFYHQQNIYPLMNKIQFLFPKIFPILKYIFVKN